MKLKYSWNVFPQKHKRTSWIKINKKLTISSDPYHSQFDEVSLSEVGFYSTCFYTSSILESGNDLVYSISVWERPVEILIVKTSSSSSLKL